MRKLILNLSALLLICAVNAPPASADHPLNADVQQLVWAVNTAPPFHIVDGPLVGQGICDALIAATERALRDIPARTLNRPITRAGVEIGRSENMCVPCLIYTEKGLPGTYMTQPTHWYPPHGIITTHELAAELTAKFGNPIQLEALLQENQYRFGYPDGRAYGILQPLIDSFAGDDSYRVVRTGENATTAILAMIRAGRVHYTIDYSPLTTYDQFTAGSNMAFIEIAETQNNPVLGAIGCTRNEWGHAMVERINNALPHIQSDLEFRRQLLFWFSAHPNYLDTFDQLFPRE